MNGYEGVVKLLVDRGANTEGNDKKGNTPLMYAARQDNWRIVGFFLWKVSGCRGEQQGCKYGFDDREYCVLFEVDECG